MVCYGTACTIMNYDGSKHSLGAFHMSNREAPSRIVPRVFAEDGGGYARPATCVHCGKRITRATLAWGRLWSDPTELRRPVHWACMGEYVSSALGLDGID